MRPSSKRLRLAAFVVALGATRFTIADDRALNLDVGDPARRGREAALVIDGVTDTARGDVVTPAELAARLDGVRLVFVGESHTDAEFHRVQLRVIQELHKRGRQVLVGLEMYPATAAEQEWLERWRSDAGLDEEAFLAGSHWYRSWGYHWNYYREIFLFARESGIRLFGVNVPREVVQTARTKGLEALTPAERALLPPRVDTDSAEHQRLFRAFFGEADALHGNMPDAMFQGMYRAQCTWDAAMGWNALQALRTHGGDKAILVVLLIYNALTAFTTYDIVYAMTGGGPGTATTLLSFQIWKESFSMYDFGAGSAVAFIIVAISALLIVAITRALPSDLFGDG